jgi:PAS domain S-box-containing protein
MTDARYKKIVRLAIPLTAIGIFLVDLITPLGVTGWVCYLIPLLFSLRAGNRSLPYALAAGCSLLVVLGYFLSPPGIDPRLALTSRLAGVLVLWVMAFVIRHGQQTVAKMHWLSGAVEHSPVSIVITNRAGDIEYVNPKFTEVTGYAFKEVIGKNPRILKSGEMPLDNYRLMWKTITAGGEWCGEFHNRKKNGELYWELASISPLADDAGVITHFLAVKEDITERKRAEVALATEQRLLNSLITTIPDQVYFKDRNGRFFRVNEAFIRRHGLSDARQLLGRTDFDLFGEEHARQACEDEQKIMNTGEPMIDREEKEDWKDKHVTWVSSTKLPLRDETGKIVGIMGISRDITARKLAEEHIREQAALLDKAQDAIFVLDAEDHITYWNQSAERIYGWTAADAIGKTMVDLLFKGMATPQLANAIKTVNERGEWVGELQEYTKAGKAVTVQARCNLIRDEQGRPKSRLIINTDITEKKMFEYQFLRSQRMEGIGALASGIAHDLNNVLTPLLVFVQVLKEQITDAEGQEMLKTLEINVQRGASLVKQVLVFGRGVAGERVMVNPKHIASEIRQIINETFPKSLSFELQCAPDLWTVTGDPTQLHQVMLNLCVNARDAMPNGGKLSLHLTNLRFDETYASMNPEARAGPYVLIQVKDTGTGIPKEFQDRIFDPFFTTKEPGKGSGLGLSTTLSIVKAHGGFIHCHSAPDQGSTFEIYLPADALPVAVAGPPAEEPELPHGHDELVLLVDDEEPIRKIARKTLERFGYRVLLASDGAEAISLYASRRHEIDVVITDMVMPVMDGPATIAALKAINSNIKIVCSSGMASENDLARARDAGIRHFIAKPYTAETMLTTLQKILHERDAD